MPPLCWSVVNLGPVLLDVGQGLSFRALCARWLVQVWECTLGCVCCVNGPGVCV